MNALDRYAGSSPFVRKEQALDLSAALIAATLIALAAASSVGLPRILLTLAFTFFVPGRAIVSNWPRMARWSAAAMPMVLSLAIVSLLATLALCVHLWHPIQLFDFEATASLGGLAIGARRRYSLTKLHRGRPGDDRHE